MPQTKEANRHTRENQRGRSWKALTRMAASKNLAVTIAEIVTAARISQGLTYHYSAAKEEIFRELTEQIIHSGFEVMKQFIGGDQAKDPATAGNSDQLLMITSIWLECLNRWKLFALRYIDKQWPDVAIALQMLKSGADEKDG